MCASATGLDTSCYSDKLMNVCEIDTCDFDILGF